MSIFDKFKRKLKKPTAQKDDSERARLDPRESERARFAAVGDGESPGSKPESRSKVQSKPATTGVHGFGGIDRVIMGPVVTEKASDLRKFNKYVFEVSEGANKSQIKKAFAVYYGVAPRKVNSVRLPGKPVRFGRTQGTTKVRRKVIVTLPKGKTIEI